MRYYIESPSPAMSMLLQHKTVGLKYAIRQQQMEMEKRIAENVLKSISMQLETNGAISEIESLKKAIENLGK